MKITRIETIQAPEHPRILWVRIHTDEGITGLGETYVHVEPVRSVIETVFAAEFLLGKDPFQIESIWKSLFDRCNYVGWAGAEIRAISAIDIALWDILGQAAGMPIYQLLGGKSRDRIRIYNTCGGEIGLDFLINPVEYACSLLESGITAMKIWPFDQLATESGGHYISVDGLRKGVEPIKRIREELGEKMEVAIEFHGHWDLPSAIRIGRALEDYQPMWLEDMMQVENLDAYRRLQQAVRTPLVISERLYTRYQFLPLLQQGIAQIINPDVEWCGGVTEVHKIASMADTYRIPVALHNYGGPILNVVSAQVAANIPNTMILETGRDLLALWTDDIIEYPIRIEGGFLCLPEENGVGNRLSKKFLERDDLLTHVIE
jgi:galactonate dehydratase